MASPVALDLVEAWVVEVQDSPAARQSWGSNMVHSYSSSNKLETKYGEVVEDQELQRVRPSQGYETCGVAISIRN
jgi:hypothetical protein